MATKKDLIDLLYIALKALGGSARIPEICKYVWDNNEQELRESGELFYTWQYDIRWAGYQLRQTGKMKPNKFSPKGVWELK